MRILVTIVIAFIASLGLVATLLHAEVIIPVDDLGGAKEDALLREYINSTAKETICDVDTLMTFINASALERTAILEGFRTGKLSTITSEIQELDEKKLELETKADVLTK